MKNIKISLAVVALILSTGISIATSATQSATTFCSPGPSGQGGVGTPSQFGCTTPGLSVCCYRIPDNVVITKNW